jgi:DNA end-binding protein Ku
MPSAIWTGAISFGLVQVPVRLVGATKSKDVSFNQLEEGTNSRIRYRKVSETTGEEVPADKIVRGFEVSKGRYVVIEQDEIDALRPKGSHAIEIEEFVDLDDIDPLFFEQPYYLVPDARGVKPYRLLVDAMTELNKVAIGRIVVAAGRDPTARRHAVHRDDALRRRGAAPRRLDPRE